MDPVFGWGPECRFSWDTAKKMLEAEFHVPKVDWPSEDEDYNTKVTKFFPTAIKDDGARYTELDELSGWFGGRVTETVF